MPLRPATERNDIVFDLITLPLRIAASATRLGFEVSERAVGALVNAAERLIGVGEEAPGQAAAPARGEDRKGASLAVVVAMPAPSGSASDPVPEIPDPAPPDAELASQPPDTAPVPSAHVSAEPEFVEAFAEPGAEEGAGASVRVLEPWEGYGKMTASEIIARLDGATREALADVALYEELHRQRRTVVIEARRQLQQATATAARHA